MDVLEIGSKYIASRFSALTEDGAPFYVVDFSTSGGTYFELQYELVNALVKRKEICRGVIYYIDDNKPLFRFISEPGVDGWNVKVINVASNHCQLDVTL